jgi:hypothetical protein
MAAPNSNQLPAASRIAVAILNARSAKVGCGA